MMSASLGHAPDQPPAHLLEGPLLSRAWDTPSVDSPKWAYPLPLDAPQMLKLRGPDPTRRWSEWQVCSFPGSGGPRQDGDLGETRELDT